MNSNETVMAVDWTKQNQEMNDLDKVFCDTLYRVLRLMKREELEEGVNSEIKPEEK